MSEVLSVKVDKEKLRLLEEIAREEQSDRSTVARRLLDAGMRGWKVERAVRMFSEGRLSLWKAATTADISLREFIDVLNERKVPWVGVKADELRAEAEAIQKETR